DHAVAVVVLAIAHFGRGARTALAHQIPAYASERPRAALPHVEPTRGRARAAAARAGEDLVGVVDDPVAVVVQAIAGLWDGRAVRAAARNIVDEAIAVVVDAIAHLGRRGAGR